MERHDQFNDLLRIRKMEGHGIGIKETLIGGSDGISAGPVTPPTDLITFDYIKKI
jgi:hypothetical protein